MPIAKPAGCTCTFIVNSKYGPDPIYARREPTCPQHATMTEADRRAIRDAQPNLTVERR